MLRQFFLSIIAVSNIIKVNSEPLEDVFANCRISKPDFDECLKYALNQLNPLFKYGLPEYGGKYTTRSMITL